MLLFYLNLSYNSLSYYNLECVVECGSLGTLVKWPAQAAWRDQRATSTSRWPPPKAVARMCAARIFTSVRCFCCCFFRSFLLPYK